MFIGKLGDDRATRRSTCNHCQTPVRPPSAGPTSHRRGGAYSVRRNLIERQLQVLNLVAILSISSSSSQTPTAQTGCVEGATLPVAPVSATTQLGSSALSVKGDHDSRYESKISRVIANKGRIDLPQFYKPSPSRKPGGNVSDSWMHTKQPVQISKALLIVLYEIANLPTYLQSPAREQFPKPHSTFLQYFLVSRVPPTPESSLSSISL